MCVAAHDWKSVDVTAGDVTRRSPAKPGVSRSRELNGARADPLGQPYPVIEHSYFVCKCNLFAKKIALALECSNISRGSRSAFVAAARFSVVLISIFIR